MKDIKEEIEQAILRMRMEEVERCIDEGREREMLNDFLEVIGGALEVVIDGIHNPDLEKALKDRYTQGMIGDIQAGKITVPEDMREEVGGVILQFRLGLGETKP